MKQQVIEALIQSMGAAYNPTQPRYPEGHPKGGQWRPSGATVVSMNPKKRSKTISSEMKVVVNNVHRAIHDVARQNFVDRPDFKQIYEKLGMSPHKFSKWGEGDKTFDEAVATLNRVKALDQKVHDMHNIEGVMHSIFNDHYSRLVREALAEDPHIMDEFGDDFKEFAGYIDDQQKTVDDIYMGAYDATDTLYRGSRVREALSIIETGEIGTGGGKYPFVSLTTSPYVAESFAFGWNPDLEEAMPILLEFPKKKVDKHIVHHGYSVLKRHKRTAPSGKEGLNIAMTEKFLFEEEHRLPDNKLSAKKSGVRVRLKNVDKGYHEIPESVLHKWKKIFEEGGLEVIVDV